MATIGQHSVPVCEATLWAFPTCRSTDTPSSSLRPWSPCCDCQSPHKDVGGTIASLVCSVHIQPPRAGLAPREGAALAPPLRLPNPGSLSVRKTGGDLRAGAQGQGHTVLYFCLRREPPSLVNLRKRNLEPGEEELASRLDHYKAKATRHIFLIRHSQYHVDASLEKDRTLTPLGTWLGPPAEASLLEGALGALGLFGPVSGVLGPDASPVIISNNQPNLTQALKTSSTLKLLRWILPAGTRPSEVAPPGAPSGLTWLLESLPQRLPHKRWRVSAAPRGGRLRQFLAAVNGAAGQSSRLGLCAHVSVGEIPSKETQGGWR